MNQALCPVDGIEWCVCALYGQDTERIGTYCTIIIIFRHANMAQGLDGCLWAVGSLEEEKMRVGCLGDSCLEDVGSYLAIVHMGNGCGGYGSGLFFPAGSELAGGDETLTGHVFFLDFGKECQDLTGYSLVQQLDLPQLTAKELEDLPNQLTALWPIALGHLGD